KTHTVISLIVVRTQEVHRTTFFLELNVTRKKNYCCQATTPSSHYTNLAVKSICLFFHSNQYLVPKMLRQRVLAVALVEGERLSADKQRSVWVHETLKKRLDHGEYHQLVQELLLHEGCFQAYFRMTQGQFDNLLSIAGPYSSGYAATNTTSLSSIVSQL
ncbi:hypothetical protein P3581_23460, partial [Vibrio parahaemolyticus]|nr:hypothetical protein [Vibrio parahaemolyticus]